MVFTIEIGLIQTFYIWCLQKIELLALSLKKIMSSCLNISLQLHLYHSSLKMRNTGRWYETGGSVPVRYQKNCVSFHFWSICFNATGGRSSSSERRNLKELQEINRWRNKREKLLNLTVTQTNRNLWVEKQELWNKNPKQELEKIGLRALLLLFGQGGVGRVVWDFYNPTSR